jgi:cellulose synthase operon protein C
MRVTCPSCQAAYNIDEKRVPPGGAKLKCSKCQSLFPIQAPVVAPVGFDSGAVPLPGFGIPPSPQPRPPAVAAPPLSTTTGVIPLPSLGLPPRGEPSGAFPRLTTTSPQTEGRAQSLTTGAIPLPPLKTPVPRPGATSPALGAPVPRRSGDRTVAFPMPPEAPPPPTPGAVGLPAPSRSGAFSPAPRPSQPPPPSYPPPPLPQAPARPPVQPRSDPVPSDAPLPGGDPFSEFDLTDASPGLHSGPPPSGLFAPPPPALTGSGPARTNERSGFGEVDLGLDDANATALPIPPDEPIPAPPAEQMAWNEGAAPPDALDLSDLPHTQASASLDASSPLARDPLEFDPTAPPEENLEADLDSPLPATTRPPEDGLEVLSFLEDAAKEAKPRLGRVTRFHVRRRSGKVFGPFEPGVIVKMLEDGQLLGNEDVSLDGEAWTPLGGVPKFADAMQRLVASPSGAPSGTPLPTSAPAAERPKLNLDQLAQAYGGRMAVVSVVDGTAQAARRRKLLSMGGIVAGALVVLAAGASLGFTRYGPFGLRWVFPARVSSGSPDGKTFAEARAGLAEDTWPGLRRARAKLEALLDRRESPDVRAVWCQSVFYEQRRWGTADAATVAKASAAVEDLKLLSTSDPERVKAEVGQQLLQKQSDAALARLRAARLDSEGPFLEAEALVQKGQLPQAAEVLDRAMKVAPSARGWHALGLIQETLGKAGPSDAAFAEALTLGPQHVASAVERAAVALTLKGDATAALGHVEPALVDPKSLSPAERARGLAVRGAALLTLGRAQDALAGLEDAVRLDGTSVLAKGSLAQAQSALHHDEQALPLWTQVVSAEPKNPAWAIGQIRSLLALKKGEEALAAGTRALASSPKSGQLHLLTGRAQDQLDRLTDAETSYKKSGELDPDKAEAGIALGRLYLRLHRLADARTTLMALVEKRPQDARARVALGDVALAAGDVGAAQPEYERATALAPELAEAWVARARAANERKDWAEARTLSEKALGLDPEVQDGRFVHGLALWKLRDLDAAATELEAARKGGSNPRLEVTLAAVEFDRGNLADSEKILAAVLKGEPGNPDANFWMARVHDKKGEFSAAQESMRSALDRAPSRASFHHEMGLILRDNKKLPDAVEAWKAAVKLDPSYADPWEALGQAYLDTGRYKEAVAAFEACLKADPTRARVLGSLGDCHSQVGKWAAAVGSYQAALKADPKLTNLYYRVALAYGELGQHDKAIGWYQRAVSVEPDSAQIYYHLGYAWKERGNKREAAAAFQKYLAKAPEAKDKKDIEDEIYFLSR